MNSKKDSTYWLWLSVLIINALLILGTAWLYDTLPLDGSSGDSSSFIPEGFLVQRIIEPRSGELEVGDIITRIDGVSIEEWLHRSPFGRVWQNGEIVEYEIVRAGQSLSLQVQLAPVSFQQVISHWWLEILTILGLFGISFFLFLKGFKNQALRWIVFFSTTISVQYWIDAYNIQPATLLWGWVFWLQVILEQVSYSFPYAAALIFILAFLYPKGLLKRYPIIFPSIILFSGTIIKLIAMTTAPTLSAAFVVGNMISVAITMVQIVLVLGITIYFIFTNQNEIHLAQLRILLMGFSLPILATFIYSISLVLTGHPIISRSTGIPLVLLVPLSFFFGILRYQIFDIEIILKKSLVYAFLSLLLGAFFLFSAGILAFITQTFFSGSHHYIIDFIPTIGIALIFNPLRLWVQKIIDRVFFRSKVDYNILLPKIMEQLSQNIVLEELTQVLTVGVPSQLEISNASLKVFSAEERNQASFPKAMEKLNQLKNEQKNQRELSIPLIIGKSHLQKEYSTKLIVGQYHLGKKRSDRLYSNEEIHLLTTLGRQVAVSVENARLYREIERQNLSLEQKIQKRTQELADAKNIAENASSLLEKVMNNLDALVYVGDMQTGEILFANRPMLKEFGDIQGKICWQVLYKNKLAPCATCTNPLLLDNPKEVQRQEVRDDLAGRWYSTVSSAIQWIDGRTVRLATLLDITEIKEAESLLLSQEHEIAREKERRKLARDLHDTLTQSLHSLVLMADTSQRLLEKERFSALPDSMQLLSESARQALREMRLLLHELQLSEDKEIDLQETLSTRLRIVEQRIGIKTALKINGQNYLPKDFKREIFYIVVEALNNSIRHSYAEQILVTIQASPEKIEVLVRDNGRGFTTKPLGERGMGIENMRFRADKLGGTLEITSAPRDGTEVRLSIDLSLQVSG